MDFAGQSPAHLKQSMHAREGAPPCTQGGAAFHFTLIHLILACYSYARNDKSKLVARITSFVEI
eukprot:3385425-Lingulodinium_polyedra.AAC.1